MSNQRFLFITGSARPDGNTDALARQAASHLPDTARQEWLNLDDLPLPPFRDMRHAADGVPDPVGNEKILFDATLAATDIVIASPLYWYSVSASVKLYVDYWAGWLYRKDLGFKSGMRGRTLWGVTVLAERDEAQADPLVGMLHKTADYMHMDFGGVLLGNGSRPGDVLRDERALRRAEQFFAAARHGLPRVSVQV
ncbi:multimeric flavodoxin WrbA [Herbihabitans rhizosphaerae]|uniref:Multimeric flavodoxin WrbA n=1 Tax=Herbihabitans rhizosphaerae TaxID=1872711 RepID=A0A4Q7KEW8_9PSEU|nr:NAD(P)H-dependent oxidoreductase [Herbihabitans rhizosphaerae]RZS32500.1 multimeric flavodoxin WrbA [Herbihabitans rhizosphaerae]